MNAEAEGSAGGTHRRRRSAAARGEGEAVVVGEIALGRFRLVERIGAGGFGTVYRGWDQRLERPVAVKVIEARGRAGRRVLREAQAAARLNHPGIVTLYELGETDGRAYLVSELVEGATLDRLASEGRLSDRDVADLGGELCEALAHAHDHGVVHRDIKPQNVIVRDDGAPTAAGSVQAKLMDFGTACLVDAPALTATGEVIGTIAYMAPEQAEGGEVGPKADVYALALTLYECWSGENPLVRSTPAATARAIGEPVAPLSEARPDIPAPLCDLLDACLGAEPERRPGLDQLATGLDASSSHLDDVEPVPKPRGREWGLHGPSPRAGAAMRVAVLAALTALVAWLGLVAGRPGAALVCGALMAPALLLLPSPAHWGLPALAPALGAIGLAPVYPALAALAGTAARRAVLAVIGWAWLVAGEAILGRRLLFDTAAPAPDGWTTSVAEAASGVLFPVLTPESMLAALVWAIGAVLLGAVIRGRMLALEVLAVLVWAAALITLHGALARGGPEPAAGPIVVALILVCVATLWTRTMRPSRAGPGHG
jgi:tRNA A-37 threonylcarbamoyl transferase component Bud32